MTVMNGIPVAEPPIHTGESFKLLLVIPPWIVVFPSPFIPTATIWNIQRKAYRRPLRWSGLHITI